METLNANAAKTFVALLEEMHGHDTLRIENGEFPVLLVTRDGKAVETEYGTGTTYLIAQLETSGDKEYSRTEMGFVYISESAVHNGITTAKVIPFFYYNALSGLYGKSIVPEHGKPSQFRPNMQHDQTGYANIWMLDIKAQGYLDKPQNH